MLGNQLQCQSTAVLASTNDVTPLGRTTTASVAINATGWEVMNIFNITIGAVITQNTKCVQ
jgi:hypothetical protein